MLPNINYDVVSVDSWGVFPVSYYTNPIVN